MSADISLDAMPLPLVNERGIAWLDSVDLQAASSLRWRLLIPKSSKTAYAHAAVRRGEGWTSLLLHRFVARRMGLDISEHVDHRNRFGLDCTRRNLRAATALENTGNTGPKKTNKSGYRGVYLDKDNDNWRAQIGIDRKPFHIGSFADKDEAARAYDRVAVEHFGRDFAYLNFPGELSRC